jgi:EpsI family protein
MSRRTIYALAIALMFGGALVVTHVVSARAEAVVHQPELESIPLTLGDWRGQQAPPLDAESARQLSADQYFHRYYVAPSGIVETDVAYYTQRRVGASMHSPLNCLPGNGWTVSDSRSLTITAPQGPVDIRELTVRRNKVLFALAYWYQSGNRVLTGEMSTRARLLSDALMQRPADVGLVRVMTRLQTENAPERAVVAAFSAVIIPELQHAWNPRNSQFTIQNSQFTNGL